jgi:phage baseplate assembly protein W
VSELLSVHGARNNRRFLFRAGADYTLLEDRRTLAWLEGARLPDPGTVLQVSYYPVGAERPHTPDNREGVLDLRVVSGEENLAQAIMMRLLTPRGELSALGHPEYGSRLHELIGRPNTETSRNLAKLFILESLKMEPRIEGQVTVVVEPARDGRGRVKVALQVRPVGASKVVTIGPFTLELAP